MAKYYIQIDSGTLCKNNAEKAVWAYIRALDGTLLLSENAKNDFVKNVRNQVAKINKEHTRCGDVRVSSEWGNGIARSISFGETICYIRICKVVKEYEHN